MRTRSVLASGISLPIPWHWDMRLMRLNVRFMLTLWKPPLQVQHRNRGSPLHQPCLVSLLKLSPSEQNGPPVIWEPLVTRVWSSVEVTPRGLHPPLLHWQTLTLFFTLFWSMWFRKRFTAGTLTYWEKPEMVSKNYRAWPGNRERSFVKIITSVPLVVVIRQSSL